MLFRKSETQIKVKHIGEAERMDTNRSSGFTLIELLVVIAIIGFLAAVVMSSLQSAREKAYDAQIKSDMGQIRNALELYANDNNYTYPPTTAPIAMADSHSMIVESADGAFSVSTFSKILSPIVGKFVYAKSVYAQSEAERNPNCTYFDDLSSVLVPNYIGAIPQHPLDDGVDVCYQYYISASGATAVAYAPLVTEHYGSGASKQVGVALGNTDSDSLSAICNEILGANESGSTPFPLFSGGGTSCTGTIADAVIGITSGSGDVSHAESCSIPEYDNEEDCETDHSSCSDTQYTAAGESVCEANGITSGGSCQDHPEYTTEQTCEGATYNVGAGCSSGSYPDEASCEGAGYYDGAACVGGDGNGGVHATQSACLAAQYISDPAHCSSGSYPDSNSCTTAGATNGSCVGGDGGGGAYTTQSACLAAQYISDPAHCNGGSYPDSGSCTGAEYLVSDGYCQDGVSSEGDCPSGEWVPAVYAPYNYAWIPDVYTSYGYEWTAGSPGYGYTWIPDVYTSSGYQWNPGTFIPHGFEWNPGTPTSYGYQWVGESYTPNVWTSSPAGTWGVYGD